MITPKSRDVGRVVKYRVIDKETGGRWVTGRIESFNNMVVFVIVDGEPKPFNRVELEWAK